MKIVLHILHKVNKQITLKFKYDNIIDPYYIMYLLVDIMVAGKALVQ